MEVYVQRPKLRSNDYRKNVKATLDLHLKDWLKLPLDEINKQMVVRRHQEMALHPVGSNRTLRMVRSIRNHAGRTHDLPESPTMAIEWFEERPNGTIIDDLSEWRDKVNELFNLIHRIYYELLLSTGLRKSEALTLEWKNIHEDCIHIPMTKNGRSFDLPILQLHHEIFVPLRA